jgi:hypothetical protein
LPKPGGSQHRQQQQQHQQHQQNQEQEQQQELLMVVEVLAAAVVWLRWKLSCGMPRERKWLKHGGWWRRWRGNGSAKRQPWLQQKRQVRMRRRLLVV